MRSAGSFAEWLTGWVSASADLAATCPAVKIGAMRGFTLINRDYGHHWRCISNETGPPLPQGYPRNLCVAPRPGGRAVMAGRHRKRPGLPVQIPPQRRASRPVGMVDARTRVEHLVPDDVLATHRLNYLTRCGVVILAASLTEPGRSRCRACAR
jgi:hypothetical protein